ncbi:hypothetical protein LXL04_006713 [Taraxacum kok-saghyz]
MLKTQDIFVKVGLLDSQPLGTPLATQDVFTGSRSAFHDPIFQWICGYVKGALTHGLRFLHPTKSDLIRYYDENWARCIETRRSTNGYSVFFGGSLISWSAKKQSTVSHSSCMLSNMSHNPTIIRRFHNDVHLITSIISKTITHRFLRTTNSVNEKSINPPPPPPQQVGVRKLLRSQRVIEFARV